MSKGNQEAQSEVDTHLLLGPAASVRTGFLQKQVASPMSMLTSPLPSLQSPSFEVLVAFPNLPHLHAPCFHSNARFSSLA